MAANPGQFPPSKTGNKTASANNNITTTNRQRAPLQPVKRHSAQGAYYYDESKDDSSVSCSVMSAVNEKASAPFGTLPISKANNKGECNKLVEAPIDITNWKAESVTDKSLPKPTRPVYYDATYDDVPKSLEKSSSVTVSSEKHSISATASEKALARKLRRRELRSMKTAREATTESEATGSESTSEESQHDALLLRANSHNKANNKGECNKLVEAPIDITNWKAESVTDKSLPKPTRPVYYDATYDDVPKSLEKSSSVTVSSEKHSISATASEKALARKLRRRELRSMKTAREATTESEATGSESTSEESQHDALLLRANSHNKAYQNHGTLKPVHCGVGSSSVVANKLVSSICAATTKPKSKTTTNALPTTKTNKDVTVAVLEKQPPKQYNRAVDGEQRCVACEGAEKFFKKMLNKSAAEIALKGEHKTLVKKARHISEFCKSLSDEGRNRYAHMVNFNECALRLEPTVPGDVKYIHASRIRHAYGNFILAQGPTRRTLVDFYRLVWLNRIRLIVCVDPLVNPRNCVHYFEFNVSKTFKAGSFLYRFS
ncbi:Tyrosine-protein phosphatase 3 [Toxocara canis]|uniref:Tyrosine-protein phosphatase 3 n=1 Tax=Toxocara canis TaxID=6265 RepID=A0A0B2VV67_TOXCA|nr:Tyrosine-protein phosphatase 3 [Toxocara canis]